MLFIVNTYLDIKEQKFAICNNTDRTVRHFVDGTERQIHMFPLLGESWRVDLGKEKNHCYQGLRSTGEEGWSGQWVQRAGAFREGLLIPTPPYVDIYGWWWTESSKEPVERIWNVLNTKKWEIPEEFSKIAQRVEVFGAKFDNLSPLPRSYVVEERKEPTPTNCPLTSTYGPWHAHLPK